MSINNFPEESEELVMCISLSELLEKFDASYDAQRAPALALQTAGGDTSERAEGSAATSSAALAVSLLKCDIEGSEVDALNGIADKEWRHDLT